MSSMLLVVSANMDTADAYLTTSEAETQHSLRKTPLTAVQIWAGIAPDECATARPCGSFNHSHCYALNKKRYPNHTSSQRQKPVLASATSRCSCQLSKNMYGLQKLVLSTLPVLYTLNYPNIAYSCPKPTVSSTAIVSFWLSASNVLYAGKSRRLKLHRVSNCKYWSGKVETYHVCDLGN